MKFILLAAVAAIATPAIAQQTPAGSTTDTSATSQTTDASAAPASGATTSAPAPMTTGSGDPVGGYQPTGAAVSGGTPGATLPPTFQAPQSPDQAYPAPAPLAKYPICKKGQYDKCKQRGGK